VCVESDKLEILDLTAKLFKKHAVFLEYMSEFDKCSIREFAERSKLRYKSLSYIIDYFEARGIVERYQPSNISDKRCIYISLTPRGRDLCGALLDFTHVMKFGTKLKEPHFGDYGTPGVIVFNFKELRHEIGRRRRNKR
jgi:DNA-binding MarR family transcriptional regulator